MPNDASETIELRLRIIELEAALTAERRRYAELAGVNLDLQLEVDELKRANRVLAERVVAVLPAAKPNRPDDP
jgi:hypothetical protein